MLKQAELHRIESSQVVLLSDSKATCLGKDTSESGNETLSIAELDRMKTAPDRRSQSGAAESNGISPDRQQTLSDTSEVS